MIIPTLLYSFFLFLKLAVRLGLTGELVSAWPLWLGVALGTQLVKLDRILAEYLRLYQQKDIKEINARSLIKNFNIALRRLMGRPGSAGKSPAVDLVPEKGEVLISQNIVFAAGWAGVALFGMTSTIGFLGKGVVLGVGLQLAIRVAKSLFEIKEKIAVKPDRLTWFFAPIKRQLPGNEMAIAALIFLGIFIVFSFL